MHFDKALKALVVQPYDFIFLSFMLGVELSDLIFEKVFVNEDERLINDLKSKSPVIDVEAIDENGDLISSGERSPKKKVPVVKVCLVRGGDQESEILVKILLLKKIMIW